MNSTVSHHHSGAEPTVFGAARRYWLMVILVALLTMAAFVGYMQITPPVYQANASVTVPQELSLKDQLADQYLDRQMLLLESQDVAQRALYIANNELGGDVFELSDFSTEHGSLEISPPEGYTPGAYGANTINLTFRWMNSSGAQTGANAVLQAFDEVRADSIKDHAAVAMGAIQQAIDDSRNQDQREELLAQRATMLVNQQIDLAQHPTFQWAVEPQSPANRDETGTAVLGLLIGAILGTAVSYALAARRQIFDDRFTPAALYGAPLIGEIPAFKGWRKGTRGGGATGGLLPVTSAPRSAAAEAFRFTAGSIERIRDAHGSTPSVVFVAPMEGSGKGTVVANVALALAEGGRRVLAVDADPGGDLTALLLPDASVDGFEQVLAGRRALVECIRTSPRNADLMVLPAGRPANGRVTGATYAKAVDSMLAASKQSVDIILIDSPALLAAANAAQLVAVADVAVVVVRSSDQVRDHRAMVERLVLVETEFVGYVNEKADVPSRRARLRRLRTESARPADPGPVQLPHLDDARCESPDEVVHVQSENGKGDLHPLPQAHR